MLKLAVIFAVAAVAAADVRPFNDGRIVGGHETSIEKYPHQVLFTIMQFE